MPSSLLHLLKAVMLFAHVGPFVPLDGLISANITFHTKSPLDFTISRLRDFIRMARPMSHQTLAEQVLEQASGAPRATARGDHLAVQRLARAHP